MNKQKRVINKLPAECKPPAYPFTPQDILAKLRLALQGQRGSPMIFRKIAQITGQSTNTTHYWWHQSFHPHAVAFMCLLEQLSPAKRQELIGSFCRVLPSLEHSRLSSSPKTLAVLVDVLRRRSGMTVLFGGSDSERHFIAGALAHAFPRIDPERRDVAGLDLHRPSEFVPVPALLYVSPEGDPVQFRALVNSLWAHISSSKAPLLLFSGVWSSLPERRHQIIHWSKRRHVLLVESEAPTMSTSKQKSKSPGWFLNISSGRNHTGAISLSFSRGNPLIP